MSMKKKTVLIYFIVTALVIVVLPLATIFVFPRLPGHDLLLRYISTIASWPWWPVVTIVLFIFFCLCFRTQIATKIEATKSFGVGNMGVGFFPQSSAPRPPSPPSDDKDLTAVKSRVQELERLLFFERTAKVMFRSQLGLLWEISTRGSITNDFAYEWYRTYFRGNTSITPYGAYIEFLKTSLLITPEPLEMRLTPIGIIFLEFMRQYPIHIMLPI